MVVAFLAWKGWSNGSKGSKQKKGTWKEPYVRIYCLAWTMKDYLLQQRHAVCTKPISKFSFDPSLQQCCKCGHSRTLLKILETDTSREEGFSDEQLQALLDIAKRGNHVLCAKMINKWIIRNARDTVT